MQKTVKAIDREEEIHLAARGKCSENLSMHLRLWAWTAAVVVCVIAGGKIPSGSELFLLPLLWLIGGTALFGVYSVGKTASYKRSSFINTVLGTVAMLPALRTFAGVQKKKIIKRSSLWLRTIPILGGLYDMVAQEAGNATCHGAYVLNVSFVWSIATLFFVGVVYTFGFGVLVKFWVVPFLIFNAWVSSAWKITLSLKLSLRVPKVLNPSKYATKIMDEARTLGWRKRVFLLKLYTFLFGKDMIFTLEDGTELCRKLVKPMIKKKRSKKIKRKNKWVTRIWLFGSPLVALYGIMTTRLQMYTALVAVIFYFVGGLGITAGYHRLLSHRAYEAHWLLKYVLLVMGTSAFEGSALWWCSDHRTHHRYTDTQKDPYNAKEGFWYSHIGWLLHEPPHEHRRGDFSKYSDIRDLTADPVLRFQHKFYGPLALFFGLFVPAAICGIWLDDWRGGWFYAAFLKAVIVQHSTFCINSLAHVWGEWTFSDQRTPRDNVLIAFITFGEGFHNFHHEFPDDFRNGIRWFDYDPTKWLISISNFFGLAWNLKRFESQAIEQGRLHMMQKELDKKKSQYDWGPDVETLPEMSRSDFDRKVQDGASLLIVDGVVHDVETFVDKHPAGPKFLKIHFGKDATKSFNGGIYNHSYAARHILARHRVARFVE